MFKRILVPLDGSAVSEGAVALAGSIARAFDAHITLMRAVDDIAPVPYEITGGSDIAEEIIASRVAEAGDYLNKVAATLAGVETDIKVMRGIAAQCIVILAQDGYDLITMNTHGRSGVMRTLMGSVAMQVVRETNLPVLLLNNRVPADQYHDKDFHFRRILVPLDGSPLAEQVMPLAVKAAHKLGAELLLVHILPPAAEQEVSIAHAVGKNKDDDADYVVNEQERPATHFYLEQVASQYIPDDVAYIIVGYAGKPAPDILALISERHCDMVMMTTHARAGLQRIIEGSVAERVVGKSPVPVLLLRGNETHN